MSANPAKLIRDKYVDNMPKVLKQLQQMTDEELFVLQRHVGELAYMVSVETSNRSGLKE